MSRRIDVRPDDVTAAKRLGEEIGPMLAGHSCAIVLTVLEVITEQALRQLMREYDMDLDTVLDTHVKNLRRFMDQSSILQ